MKRNSIQQVLFHFIWSTGSIKTFKLCNTKNYLEINLLEKKKHFVKYFVVCKTFLKLQCLVNDLVDSLELLRFIYAYIQYII